MLETKRTEELQIFLQQIIPHHNDAKKVTIHFHIKEGTLTQFRQKFGGLIFWDKVNGNQQLKKVQLELKRFNRWREEWTKQLEKWAINIWSDTTLSSFIPEDQSM